MGSKKKTNPNRRPATQADVERARREGRVDGARFMAATYTMVLRDKKRDTLPEGELLEIWKMVDKLWQEIREGRISYADILHTLEEEEQITFNFC